MAHRKDQHHLVSRGGWPLMGRLLMWSMRNKNAG